MRARWLRGCLRPRPGRLAACWLPCALTAVAVAAGAPATPSGRAVVVHRDARVWIWKIRYRSHMGALRNAYVDLPAWYGPRDDPPLPLVISPHGRQALARANSRLWGDLPAAGVFAVVNPQGQGRLLQDESWGDPAQIRDLARMPGLVRAGLPWLRIDGARVFAIGGSMGGQEALLLLARYPRLLAGVASFDAPVDLALRYRQIGALRDGARLQRWMRLEIGGIPQDEPAYYQARSPLHFARRIAFAGVPVELFWSRRDEVVIDQREQTGRLYRAIRHLDPNAPVTQTVGAWRHTREMNWGGLLPLALRRLGLLPPPASAARAGVIFHGPALPEIALTFDDGDCRACADAILRVLLRTGAHATICPNGVYGEPVWDHEAALVRLLIRRRQLAVCNHTFSHADALFLPPAQLSDELSRNERWIEREFGVTPRPFFRPPYGAYDTQVLRVAAKTGYPDTVIWSGTLADTRPHSLAYDLRAIRAWARPGAIILAHANTPQTANALPAILRLLAHEHLRPVTLTELLDASPTSPTR